MNTKQSRATHVGAGVVIGLLLSGGAFLGLKSRLTPPPVVQTVTVDRVVEKVVEKVVVKRVEVPVTNTVTNTVTEKKLFRAQLVDKEGKVSKEWVVTKCKFRVIGATLTDRDGNVFPVTGNIRIAPLDKQAVIPSDESPAVAEDNNVVDGAVFSSDVK